MIDFSQLDKTIHEKGRLSIMTLLASRVEPWAFQDLKSQLDMSDGNLITHLRTLEKAEFITGEKLTGDGRPQTLYVLTVSGRDRVCGLPRHPRANSRTREIIRLPGSSFAIQSDSPCNDSTPPRAQILCITKL